MKTKKVAPASDSRMLILITVLSVAVPLLVAFLLFMPQTGKLGQIDVSFLPKFHAILNSLTAVALMIGYYHIKNKNVRVHRLAMVTAFGLSAVFLISYVVYHFQAASTPYGGEGPLRYIYYFILLTHIVLSVAIVPLVLLSIYFGISNQLVRHRRISRWTFPIWLYVAVTGVMVYILISPYYS